MLQNIRDNSQGTIAKIIVGLIIITFALFGVESIVALGAGQDAPATVNGEEISEIDIVRVVEAQKARLRQQFGNQFNNDLFSDGFLRKSALDQLVQEKIAVTQAEELGAAVSSQAIDKVIVDTPEFQNDGKFSGERFRSVLRQNGLTPLAYRELLRTQMIVGQVSAGAAYSDIALPYEVERTSALNNEQRTYKYAEIKYSEAEANVEVSADEIQAYYDANKDNYQTEEQVSVAYVTLDRKVAETDIVVEEDDVVAEYNQYADEESAKEERKASHILIEVSDERTDEDAAALALKLSEEAQSGGDFAALAQENSDDIGTKNLGGDLGYNRKGAFTEEFDETLFALGSGEISAPVKTEFGYHVIRLDDIRKPELQTLEERRASIESELKQARIDLQFTQMSDTLAAVAYENESIEGLLESTDLELVASETPLFTRSSGNDLATDPRVRAKAFSEEVLNDRELSEVIELSDGRLAVIGILEHKLPAVKDLALVENDIRAVLVAEKAREQVKQQVQTIVADLKAGQDVSLNWTEVSDATYTNSESAPAEINQAVFALSKKDGEVAEAATATGALVAQLQSVSVPEVGVSDQDAQTLEQSRVAESSYVYRQWAKENSKVEYPES